jgi:CBS domain-containing protein
MRELKDLMSRDVQVVNPDMTIGDAARKMRDGDFGMMPVGENDRMIGAITDRDIAIRGVAEGRGAGAKVRDVMSDDITWIYEDNSVEEAVALMSEHQVRRLPILDRNKRLVGIVALGDLAVEPSEIRPAADALAGISKPAPLTLNPAALENRRRQSHATRRAR